MIYDLRAELLDLKGETVADRLREAAEKLPDVGIVAMNGVPFIPYVTSAPKVSYDSLRDRVRLALGFGGILTYMNRSELALIRLADICIENDHDWALRSVTVTVCFAGCPPFVEMSFARDRRFHLSWVEQEDVSGPRVFTATASVKDWKKYLANRNSNDFLPVQREWLGKAYDVVCPILPEYFGEDTDED